MNQFHSGSHEYTMGGHFEFLQKFAEKFELVSPAITEKTEIGSFFIFC
jgi:hypothetical protein